MRVCSSRQVGLFIRTLGYGCRRRQSPYCLHTAEVAGSNPASPALNVLQMRKNWKPPILRRARLCRAIARAPSVLLPPAAIEELVVLPGEPASELPAEDWLERRAAQTAGMVALFVRFVRYSTRFCRTGGSRLRPLAGFFAITGVTYSASVADPTEALPPRVPFAIERGHLRLGVSRAGYLFDRNRPLDARQILFARG
jgi:hypothetical protein